LAVQVELTEDTRILVLKVDGTEDGVAHDHADWAEAQVVMEDGRVLWPDEDQPTFLAAGEPFSFLYDGRPSRDLLPGWERSVAWRDRPRRP